MSYQTTTTITIGGTVDGNPMLPAHWKGYKSALLDRVRTFGGTILADVEGPSAYNGTPEDAYWIIVVFPTYAIRPLRHSLSILAFSYCQECIGFVSQAGTKTLIYAPETLT